MKNCYIKDIRFCAKQKGIRTEEETGIMVVEASRFDKPPFPSKGANNSISRDKIDERYPKNPKK
jgi:hypothetical protein